MTAGWDPTRPVSPRLVPRRPFPAVVRLSGAGRLSAAGWLPARLERFPAAARDAYSGLTVDQRATASIAVLAAVMSVWNVVQASGYQDDEGTYTAQALSSLQGDLAPYTYWYDHPPLGWLQLAGLAWLPALLGQSDESAVGQMRYVMALYFVASAVLVYLLARRVQLRVPFAVLASAVFILSPLSLVFGRQVFIDNIGVPWLLLSFHLALCPRVRLWNHIGAGLCFAVAVLSKETLAVFGPAVLLAMLYRPSWKTRLFSVVGFLSIGGLALAFYPLMAALRGELFSGVGHVSLQDALTFQLLSRDGSGSFFDPTSDRRVLIDGWLYYDSRLIVLGLAASVVCLLRRETRWVTAALWVFCVPVVVGSGYQPAMYIIAGLPFLALAIAVAADLAWRTVTLLLLTAPDLGRHAMPARPTGAAARRLLTVGTAAVLMVALAAFMAPHWLALNRSMLVAQENADWDRTLQWSKDHLPRQDTVLVPYSMWSDLNADGRHDPWRVIALEKMDLDSDFGVHHRDGWRAVDWIVEGPSTSRNISELSLTNAGVALENSRVVTSFGDWRIREVVDDGAGTRFTAGGGE